MSCSADKVDCRHPVEASMRNKIDKKAEGVSATDPGQPSFGTLLDYWIDTWQRSILLFDVLR
jgi:hypothetical protein